MPMTSLERGHLESFCILNDIDNHEIDSSISYWENHEYLSGLTIPQEEEIYNESQCKEIEKKNKLLSWNDFIKDFKNEPLPPEKTIEEQYEDLLKEFNYKEPKKDYTWLKEHMIKSMVARISYENKIRKENLKRRLLSLFFPTCKVEEA